LTRSSAKANNVKARHDPSNVVPGRLLSRRLLSLRHARPFYPFYLHPRRPRPDGECFY
jgi:hypothetical protein